MPKLSVFNKESECLQTLTKLGLTTLQAKTYLFLAKIENANVATISKTSNVAREEIYRTIPRLERIGLVEKIIGRPNNYKALPLKVGLDMLIQKKKDADAELQKQTRTLIKSLNTNSFGKTVHEKSSQFIITSELGLFRKRFESCIAMAQKEIFVIGSQEVITGMMFNHLKCLQNAIAKGVRIRILTEKVNEKTEPRETYDLEKNRFFKLKYYFNAVPVTLALFDGKEVNIRISHELVPSLWSNNPEIVKLASSYFNEIWGKAQQLSFPRISL